MCIDQSTRLFCLGYPNPSSSTFKIFSLETEFELQWHPRSISVEIDLVKQLQILPYQSKLLLIFETKERKRLIFTLDEETIERRA